MRKIKKIFLLLLFLAFTLPLLKVKNVYADGNTFYSENNRGAITITSDSKQNIYGMDYDYVIGETISKDSLNTQELNVFSMKTDGVYSKLVNWAYQSSNRTYKRVTLDVLAKNYEETHPGWIVLGGINADQYAMEPYYAQSNVPFYPQPFYPLIMDGERRFTVGLFGSTGNFVGINNSGTEKSFVAESARKGYYLYIYDENDNIVNEFKIDGINKKAEDNQTTVWMSYEKINKTTDEPFYSPTVEGNNIYYVENPSLQYVSNAPEYERAGKNPEFVGFGRGEISQITTSCKVSAGQFAIDTNNKEVINALKVGTKIVVQDSYVSDELNNVESSAGFHTAHRLNNVDVEGVGSYDTQQYSRSIFGRKADGTYVLFTASMKTGKYRGMNQDECNAYLKSIGVVEAYQQDGGGSVCAIVRNENGNFDVVNAPKDGATRANFNGLLFVVRDPGFKTSVVKNTRNSIIIEKVSNVNDSLISNVEIKVDGRLFDMLSDTLEITGLKEDTEYEITYEFDIKDPKTNVTKRVSYQTKTKTQAFQMPSSGLRFIDPDKNSIKLVKGKGEKANWFTNIVVEIGGNKYQMNDESELVINDLIENTKYEATITYDCVEPETGNVYKGSEIKSFSTLAYKLPEIIEFVVAKETSTRVSFDFKYQDPDSVVQNAYIEVGNKEYPLTTKMGRETIKDLDLKNNQYEAKLVIIYIAGSFAKQLTSDTIKIGLNETPTKTSSITYILDGGTNDEANPLEYTEGEEVVLNNPTKEGYKFLGWYLNDTLVTKIEKTQTGDITLTAKWEYIPKTYKVTYNLDGGTNDASNPTTYTEGKNVTLKDATREGYTFLGWYLNDELVTELKDITNDITLTAKWEEIKAPKKGCSCKKDMSLIVLLTVSVSMIGILLRKKH